MLEKPHFKRFATEFFVGSQGGSPRVKMIVNLTSNAFLHRKFSSRYIVVPHGTRRRGANSSVFSFLR